MVFIVICHYAQFVQWYRVVICDNCDFCSQYKCSVHLTLRELVEKIKVTRIKMC